MKKLLLAIVLIAGCDYAPTEHTHEGVCGRKWHSTVSQSYRCYPDWDEKDCLTEELKYGDEDHVAVSWYYMTCEEFCDIPAEYECSIISGSRQSNN